MGKILHREVMAIHDAWARAHSAWGENNLETIYKLGDYQKAKERYQQEHGKPFAPKHRKGRR